MSWGHLSKTRRKTLPGGSTPASMRVTVLDRCPQHMSLVVNGTAMTILLKNNLTFKISGLNSFQSLATMPNIYSIQPGEKYMFITSESPLF